MALNFGMVGGPPPRKKSGLPPKVGKPHMTVVIAAGPKGGAPKEDDEETPAIGPPLSRAAGRRSATPAPGRAMAAPPPGLGEMDDDEANETPDAGGEGGEEHPILPEAVNYRSEQETCGNCVHMQDDGECERLHIPVSHGDGCNLFSDASGRDADESAEQFEPEEAGEEEGDNVPAYR